MLSLIATRRLTIALMLAAIDTGALARQAAPISPTPSLSHTPPMENTELAKALLRQEQQLQFSAFSNDTALELGLRMVAAAKREGKAISFAITRNGQMLFQHAMDGTSGDNAEWIRRKNNATNRFGHSSYYVAINYRTAGSILIR